MNLLPSVVQHREFARPVITVVTPLISRSRARNWEKVLECLHRTVRSVNHAANEVDAEVRHLVVCEDGLACGGANFKWIPHDPDPENHPFCGMRNVGEKLVRGFRCDEAKGSDYVMILDGDDLISRRLFAYVLQRPEFEAFCLSRGWEWNVQRNYMTLRRSFDRLCGSSHVWRYDSRIFPAWLGEDYHSPRIGDRAHNEVTQAMREAGIAYDNVVDPLVCYVKGHGQNDSDRFFRRRLDNGRIKDWLLGQWRNRSLSMELAEEFGIDFKP